MKVRCWVMVGGPQSSYTLPPEARANPEVLHSTYPPEANLFTPGQWILWKMTALGQTVSLANDAICLVCVDIPLP